MYIIDYIILWETVDPHQFVDLLQAFSAGLFAHFQFFFDATKLLFRLKAALRSTGGWASDPGTGGFHRIVYEDVLKHQYTVSNIVKLYAIVQE